MSREQRERQEYEIGSAREWTSANETGRSAVKIPAGVPLFSVKKPGTIKIDIIPYRAGKGNPDAAEGKIYWQRFYHMHRNVGPGQDSYCCPKLCSGGKLRCPICEDAQRQWADWRLLEEGPAKEREKKRIAGLGPKERQLFNVIDRANPEKGIQVWEVSFHLFGKHLKKRLDNMEPEDDFDYFHHPQKGYWLRIVATEESGGGAYNFIDCSSIEFKKRPEPYDNSIIDEAHCLDDMVVLLPYDRLLEVYEQVPAADGDKKDPPANGHRTAAGSRGAPARPAARDDDDDDEGDGGNRRARTAGTSSGSATGAGRAQVRTDDDDEGEAPRKPAARAGKEPTADELGIEEGMLVIYAAGDNDLECEVIKVSRDGTSLTLEDDDGQKHHAVSPADVRKRTPGRPKAGAAPRPAEDDDDDVPPPKGRRPGRQEGPPAPR